MTGGAPGDAERREYLRHSCTAEVEAAVQTSPGGDEPPITAEILDISAGGCALRLSEPLQPDEPFTLSLQTEFTPTIHLRCSLIWSRTLGPENSYTAGCSVEAPTDADARALAQFLDILQTLSA